MVLGGHFLESLSNFQDKLNSYVDGSDDDIAIVSEDDTANAKSSKVNNKKEQRKTTNKKQIKVNAIELDDSEPEEVVNDSEEDAVKKGAKNKSTASKKAVQKKDDDSSPEEGDNSDDEDYGKSKKKKPVSKKSASQKKKTSKSTKKNSSKTSKNSKKTQKKSAKEYQPSNRTSNSRSSKVNYTETDDYISSDESDFDSEDDAPRSKGKKSAPNKKAESKSKLPKPVAVSEMVIDSIRALGDNPKKGSTLRAIKETISMNWSVSMKAYDNKIKKFITEAIEEGKMERVKGSGFSGRFTIPGLKMKKKKKTPKLGKKFDMEEEEYTPKRSKRDDDREKDKEEEGKRREERYEQEEEKWAKWEIDHANKPKKAKAIQKEFEVEAIKGIKEKEGMKQYLVKFKGIARPRWEPEENILNCDEAIEEYVDRQNTLEEEKARWKQMTEEGRGEVARIMDVQFKKANKQEKREFLIRWKGVGPENDSWEPEEKLNCDGMIKKYMKDYDSRVAAASERQLREAPKVTERLEYASKTKSGRRTGKLGKGFRKTYAGMDEDEDWSP